MIVHHSRASRVVVMTGCPIPTTASRCDPAPRARLARVLQDPMCWNSLSAAVRGFGAVQLFRSGRMTDGSRARLCTMSGGEGPCRGPVSADGHLAPPAGCLACGFSLAAGCWLPTPGDSRRAAGGGWRERAGSRATGGCACRDARYPAQVSRSRDQPASSAAASVSTWVASRLAAGPLVSVRARTASDRIRSALARTAAT